MCVSLCVRAQDAAKLEMVLKALPMIAAEVATPLSQCDKMTMVSMGNGEIGISKLTGEVFEIMNRLPQLVQSLTGVDVARTMKAA